MKYPCTTLLAALCTTWSGAVLASDAEPKTSIQLGVARAMFNVDSKIMYGPAGTTPAGIQTDVRDKTVLPLVIDRRISGPWSVTFQGGLPPVLALHGAGTASAMGQIGSVRAWFPALMGTYTWEANSQFALHAGAGLHYTFFTGGKTNATYEGAFGGPTSRAKFSSNLGPLVKVGGTWNLDRSWFLDLSYSRYWIKTTATIDTETPGIGTVRRKITARADPGVVSFTLGYRF